MTSTSSSVPIPYYMAKNITTVGIVRQIGGLVFDAVFEENHTRYAYIANNPLSKNGLFLTDHVVVGPAEVVIRAGVSDAHLYEPDNKGKNDLYFGTVGRSQKAFELLQELQESKEPFTVQTGLKAYSNMVCTRLRAKQNKNSGLALFFEAQMTEVTYNASTIISTLLEDGSVFEQGVQAVFLGMQQPLSSYSVNMSRLTSVARALALF